MPSFPLPLRLAARLSLALVLMMGLMGPAPAPALASPAVSAPAGPTPAPANDDFANAAIITLPPDYTDTQDLTLATSQLAQGEPFSCGESDVPSVWYQYTPPASGYFEFDTAGTLLTHTLSIYTGADLAGLILFDCTSGDNLGDGAYLPELLSAGVTYYVQIAGSLAVAQAALQPAAGAQVVLSVYAPAQISGVVWNDQNGDGVQDVGEPGLPGASVSVFDSFDTIQAVVSTDADGNYSFSGLPISETLYLVFTAPPPGPWFGAPQNVGADASDSDADPDTGATITYTLTSLQALDLDAGFGVPAEIFGRAWRDLNSNDVQDAGEPGLAGINVCLISVDYNCYDSAGTAADGTYSFWVPAGDYSLAFDSPIDNRATENVGSDAADSDAQAADGLVPTFTVSLGDVLDFDAGYQNTGFGDHVWRDLNANGVQEANEPGVQGVTVDLYDGNGFVISTTTDVNGDYAFTNLAADDHAAVFHLPTGNSFSTPDAGADDALDSDADTGTGRTITFTLSTGQLDLTWDAGLTKPFFIVDNLNEYPDTTPGDGLCNDTTSVAAAPYGECSLRAAIEEANADPDFDVILFDSTVFSVTQTIPQTSQYLISASLWIDGPGSDRVNLDAGNNDRNLLIQAGYAYDVRLSGLRLANGNSSDGGGIYNDAHLTLIDLIIAAASAGNNGGGVYSYGSISATNLVITGSTAGNYGGGLYNSDYLSATGLLLDSNQAYEGGGLYNDGLTFLFTSNITGNVATDGDGGGVLNFGAFHGDNSYIQYNTALWDGGGIASEAGKRLTQAEPAFCLVANGCGPVYSTAITLTGQTYVSFNVAGVPDDYPAYGGGIYNGAGTLLVDDSQVFSNTVYGDGGGIYNDNAGLIFQSATPLASCLYCAAVATLQNGSALIANLAISNTVIDEGGPYTYTYPSRGGGLFNAGLAFVDASLIASNSANLGGGFYNDYLYLFCSCSSIRAASPVSEYVPTLFIENNSAVTANTAELENGAGFISIFNGDNPSGLGGGGFNSGQATVADSLVDQNVAGLFGGGLFNGAIDFAVAAGGLSAAEAPAAFGQAGLPFLRVISSTVSSNLADPDDVTLGAGGGVFNLIGDVEIDGGAVSGNAASLWGGGIANGCIFCLIGGNAGSAGSAASLSAPQGPGILLLFLLFSQLYVHDNAVIANNTAGSDSVPGEAAGGGVFNSGFAVIADSAVTTNTTTGVGGGVLNFLYITLDHSQVDANRSDGSGGGLYNIGFAFFAQAQAAGAALDPAGLGLGGFVFNFAPGLSLEASLVIRADSSVSNNRANPDYVALDALGGGLYTNGAALIANSTIAGNWAAADGGGLAVARSTNLAQAGAAPTCLQGLGGFFTPLVDAVVLSATVVSDNHAGWVEAKASPVAVGGGAYVGGSGCDNLPLFANDSLFDGNSATAGGGGVYVDYGEAYLHNTNLLNNNGDSDEDGDGNGGASYNNGGYLVIDPANVIGNSAQYGGGGYYDSGTTVITQTTFATNTAVINGGALLISGTAEVVVGNSTVSANTAGGTGSAIYQQDNTTNLTLANVTIANNTVGSGALAVAGAGTAGYFRTGTGPAVISNTIIYGNGGPAVDCAFTNPGTNVSGVANMGDATCNTIPGWTTANPLLGPLQYNGGPNGILTHALSSLSPALDAADTGACSASPVFGVDERNVLRLLNLACDIGAYEFESLTVIELVAFTAADQGGVVHLAWETAAEIDTAGFNLYRAAAPAGPYVQINALLIPALGPQGGSYTAQDAPGAGTWYYQLEDVDTSGGGTLHGPAAVTIGSGTTSANVIYLPLISH